MKQIALSIRFDETLYKRLAQVAESEERPVAYIVRRFIQQGLSAMAGEPKPAAGQTKADAR